MQKQLFVLFVLAVLILASGCTTTNTNTQSPVQPTTGSIELSSSPPGAEIYLNSVYRGTTPSTIPDLSNGSYHVELRLRDHTTWTMDVELQAGNTVDIDATLVPIVVPTTIPTPVPTTIPPKTVVGCWELDTFKGNGTGTYHLELQSGGTGWLTVVSPIYISWYQDPTTNVVYVSFTNPHDPTEIAHMDFDYDDTSDMLFWREESVYPFSRVPC
jgi:hypothetical protein